MSDAPGLREHLVWRGLVAMILVLPPIVWATMPRAVGVAAWPWLPPAVGTVCAVVAALNRWWTRRAPLVVSGACGLGTTIAFALPDDPGGISWWAILVYLAMVTTVLLTLVALVVPFRQEALSDEPPPRPPRRTPQLRGVALVASDEGSTQDDGVARQPERRR